MEQSLRANAAARPRNFKGLGDWFNRFWTLRRISREKKHLAKLPDHLLRDIGREDLIVPPLNPGPYGH